jgi:hypothetical protein
MAARLGCEAVPSVTIFVFSISLHSYVNSIGALPESFEEAFQWPLQRYGRSVWISDLAKVETGLCTGRPVTLFHALLHLQPEVFLFRSQNRK